MNDNHKLISHYSSMIPPSCSRHVNFSVIVKVNVWVVGLSVFAYSTVKFSLASVGMASSVLTRSRKLWALL